MMLGMEAVANYRHGQFLQPMRNRVALLEQCSARKNADRGLLT